MLVRDLYLPKQTVIEVLDKIKKVAIDVFLFWIVTRIIKG